MRVEGVGNVKGDEGKDMGDVGSKGRCRGCKEEWGEVWESV